MILQNLESLENLTATKIFEIILTWNPGAMLWLEGPGRGQYLQCLLVYIPLMPKTFINLFESVSIRYSSFNICQQPES